MSRLPPALVSTDAEDVARDVAGVRGTTMAQRGLILESLCRMAAEQTAQQPDPARVLAWQDPVSQETRELLAALRARYRRHG